METSQQEKTTISHQVKEATKTEEERQTIVHCRYKSFFSTGLRIWKSTYLVEDAGRKAQLLNAFDISLMPDWYFCQAKGGFCHFTLVFEGLSNECNSFYLREIIPEPGGFYSDKIGRNKTDVYEVEVFAE